MGPVLIVVSVALPALALAEGSPPTEIVPGAVPGESRSLYYTLGLGPPAEDSERFGARSPTLAFAVGGSIPIKGKAYVDICGFLAMAQYKDHAPSLWASDDLFLTRFGLTASGRVGHAGRQVGAYASAGLGFAYVRFAAPGGYGVYPEAVGSTMAPVLTVAGSLETHPRERSRFLTELRYSWINADLGGDFGGPVNVGGPMLCFGWKWVL
jgi:hypothetical protein